MTLRFYRIIAFAALLAGAGGVPDSWAADCPAECKCANVTVIAQARWRDVAPVEVGDKIEIAAQGRQAGTSMAGPSVGGGGSGGGGGGGDDDAPRSSGAGGSSRAGAGSGAGGLMVRIGDGPTFPVGRGFNRTADRAGKLQIVLPESDTGSNGNTTMRPSTTVSYKICR